MCASTDVVSSYGAYTMFNLSILIHTATVRQAGLANIVLACQGKPFQ